MIIKRVACLAATAAMLAFTVPAFAHGGQYRGPGDTVPPNPGGGGGGKTGGPGGPTTPGPGGPTTPTPGGPTTSGPTTPPPPAPTGGGQRTGPTTVGAGAMVIIDDLTQWQFWWEFNKDPYIQLKKAIHSGEVTSGSDDFAMGRGLKSEAKNTLAPSASDRQKKMIPALVSALEDPSSNRDIVSSCMIALAKIGSDVDPKFFKETVLPLYKKFLPNADQEKSETGALAMGIAGLPEAIPDLLELAKDSSGGRKLAKSPNGVHFRTRSFAAYGLGLISYRTKDNAVKTKVFEAAKELLDKKDERRRDIKVAALNAIRLLRPDAATEKGKALRDEAVDYCLAYMDRKDEFDQIRSHAIAAIARLLGRGGDEKGLVKQKLITIISKKSKQWKQWSQQSAIQAIGQIATPDDEAAIKAVQTYLKKGKDKQAQNYAFIALGQIGGDKNRQFLFKSLKSNRIQRMNKPWVALGLAVLDYERRQRDPNAEVDATVADAILKQMENNSNAIYAAGYAIALGVMRYQDAGDAILDRLDKVKNQEEPVGYMSVALGLMGFKESIDRINEVVDSSTRRDKALTQASIALGLLGDKEISRKLVRRMEKKGTVAVMSALASALGFIGDRNSIDPLVSILGNKQLKDIPRAFAAVALGLVGDKEPLPWNSKIAVNCNYRANVETLTNSYGTGILDIL